MFLDTELTELYGVATKVLLQAVKRNAKRFPEDLLIDAPLVGIPAVPGAQNGLRKLSQIMVDEAVTVPLGRRTGRIDAATLQTVDRSLRAFFGLEGYSPKP
ncbi:MAG: mazf-like predicted growth inhibitor,ccdB family [Gammaproteobacteria bacterium]|nr:mazf-like predicted growth inhibitor,ccdB family [Gammaproteobacteria bacterium]